MRISSVLLCIFFALSSVRADEEVKIIAFHYPPYTTESGEGESGICPEFLRLSLKEVGLDMKLLFLPPKRAIKAFQNGEGLLIATLGTLEAADYKMLQIVLIKTSIFGTAAFEDVKKVAYVRGIKKAKELVEINGLTGFPVANYISGLNALESGRVQGVHGVNPSLNYLIKDLPVDRQNKLRIIKATFSGPAGLLGKKTDLELLSRIKKGMVILREKGEYKRLVHKHLGPYLVGEEPSQYMVDEFKLLDGSPAKTSKL